MALEVTYRRRKKSDEEGWNGTTGWLRPKRGTNGLEVCYKWLRKAGLPKVRPGELVTLRITVEKVKLGA